MYLRSNLVIKKVSRPSAFCAIKVQITVFGLKHNYIKSTKYSLFAYIPNITLNIFIVYTIQISG